MKRREFLKVLGGGAVAAAAIAVGGIGVSSSIKKSRAGKKPTVYFTEEITPASMVKMYEKINQTIGGRVAIKIHTGEPYGPYILDTELVKAVQQIIPNSALVETNVLYSGPRQRTETHRKVLITNGWTFSEVDILDEDGAIMLPIKGGRRFAEMSIGKNMVNYDSMVVLTHFKGHSMGGFGGSMKNIGVGCACGPVGKAMQHNSPGRQWDITGKVFMENMVEAAKAVTDFFSEKIVYINVLNNMSIDCDCLGKAAAPVTARDLGIVASTDLLAVDQASIDLVYRMLPEDELAPLRERFESTDGLHQLTYMAEMGMGNSEYNLVKI